MKRYDCIHDHDDPYAPRCTLYFEEDPDGEWVSFSDLPIITRKPQTVEDVVALVRVLYPWAKWITKDGNGAVRIWEEKPFRLAGPWWPNDVPTKKLNISWAAEAFAGIAPEDSLTEVK